MMNSVQSLSARSRQLSKRLMFGSVFIYASTTAAIAQGLPDFASLVETEGKAVVNISVSAAVKPAALNQQPDLQQIPEQYRRFFQQPGPEQRQAPNRRSGGVGSGFIVSEDGYILTNAHVVDNAANITVRMRDRQEFNATLIGADELTDVALLKVDAAQLPVVKIAQDEEVAVGEWVLAIGSPFGFDQSATQGIVSAVSRNLPSANYVPFIQTDVAVNPGNSGGPLFNTDGEVVGINSQIYSSTGGYQGLSFAIPIDIAMNVAEQLKETGTTSRGWLGVGIQDVSPSLAESFGLDRVTGALVSSVGENTPAQAAGVQEGDIVLRFNGKTVNRSGELPSLVGAVRSGETASLTVFRDGSERELSVVIGQRGKQSVAAAVTDSTLGMKLAKMTPAELEQGVTVGVRVLELEPQSIAAESGFLADDVIVQFNGDDVTSPADVIERVDALPVGKPVPVLIQRGDNALFLTLSLPSTVE